MKPHEFIPWAMNPKTCGFAKSARFVCNLPASADIHAPNPVKVTHEKPATYPKSYDLAHSFIAVDPNWLKLSASKQLETLEELARDIQKVIDDYLNWLAKGKA